jgi:hypothetical protein
MQTSQPRKPGLQLSSLFLQRFTVLPESIGSSGGDGCSLVVVRSGRIRRLQLRLDQDLPPAADMFFGDTVIGDKVTGHNRTE